MKISTKGRYGLRAMLDLAVNAGQEQVSVAAISERQNISANYLEQVFALLRKADLVKSVKGAQGGYILAERPNCISVGRVLRALEGELTVIGSNKSDTSASNNMELCLQHVVWEQLDENINRITDSITLADLVEQYKGMNSASFIMAYI